MSQTCSECGRAAATHEMASGRGLCPDCFRTFVERAGAGTALASGASATEAIVTGIAAGGYSETVSEVAVKSAAKKRKLAQTEGFWKRLWVRVVG